jgi:hypothetical protein
VIFRRIVLRLKAGGMEICCYRRSISFFQQESVKFRWGDLVEFLADMEDKI